MRDILKRTFISCVSRFRRLKPGVFILNGHFLSRTESNDKDTFRDLLIQMQESGIELLNIQEAVQKIETGEALKCLSTCVAFTFDDGFEDCYLTLAPVLEEFGVNACLFINPNFIEGSGEYVNDFVTTKVMTPHKKPMSWSQVIDLHNRGFIIGNHTLDHLRLSELPLSAAEEQINSSKEIIEMYIGEKCNYFAWPYGQFSDFNSSLLDKVIQCHQYVFSGCNYREYYSFRGAVFNRRHFEACWRFSMLKYFLTFKRQ
jgi:peptidoglycan/xylan/chitin deacetylase (PgdA/CDA1 family)